jgi:glycosyltransferase involved in cell wall biosynthesis
LLNKNILIVSPEPWDHIFVSKHHYAICLAQRGNDVYFLNPPSTRWRETKTQYSNLKVLDYGGFWPGLRFLPAILQRINISKVYLEIQDLASVEFDIIWCFDNSVFFDFDALPEKVYKISHIVDLNQNFQFERAAETADICFATTRHIIEKLRRCNSNSYFINHGLNTNFDLCEVDLPGENNLKALYFGNLAMAYLDWEIVNKAAINSTDVDFIFIGSNGGNFDLHTNPMHLAKQKLAEYDNVYFLSPVASNQLMAYMNAGDINLIVYQQKFHKDQANPHKMMEYLYSGKPIVATFTEVCGQYSDLIQMSKSNVDWPDLFARSVHDIKKLNSRQLSDRRKKLALENTYELQLKRIIQFINE